MRNVDRFTPGAPDAGRQRGAALVELAIALPLLVVFAVVGALLPLLLPLALVAAAFCILKKA